MATGKLTNFRGIFGCKFDDQVVQGITIPIVQRDYAQGRITADVNRIRQRFLQVLYDALVEGRPTTLDFVYGDIEDGKLIPLDGQQRLTTLFLLHFYIARHEGIDCDEWAFLKNFTYETRVSSREFCRHLLEYKPDFEADNLTEQISDEAWFLMEWDNDPTIQAMLVMLDSIHAMFRHTADLWSQLMSDCITFYFLALTDMGVTDEIYIKMNSRGKLLTRFEHLKAELELKMKAVDDMTAKRIVAKIDTDWTYMLWPYRNSGTGNQEDVIIDDEFVRYIHFISDIISYRNGGIEITDEFDIIEQQFSNKCENALDNIKTLETLFDIWTKIDIDAFFSQYITPTGHENGKIFIDANNINLFSECCRCYGLRNGRRPQFPLGLTILLYAFIIYREHENEIEEQDFRRRIRIVNNLVKNSPDTVRTEYMKELLSQVDKIIIYGILEQPQEGKARFQSRQMDEEIEKLAWTKEHPNMAETLFLLEDHPYLNGFISAVGLNHVDWCDRFYSLFSCNLNDVNRALLAKGDYFEKDSWRFQIGTSNPKMCNTVWRDLFSPIRLEKEMCDALQSLLSDHEDFNDRKLQEIAWNYLQSAREMPVRYYLVKYRQMQTNKAGEYRFGKYYWRQHYESGNSNYNVLLMTTEYSLGGMNYDIFLKTLYELAGGETLGLALGDYSYSEYNNGQKDKLNMTIQHLYLTLCDNVYSICKEENGEVLETVAVKQNEAGHDVEDRIQVGLRLLNKYMNLYSEDKIRDYIKRCEWTFAKTMPQWPHEYIVKGNCSLTDDEFIKFVLAQRSLGEYEVWGPYRQPYFYIDGYKYWTMGCEIEITTVINRAKA